MAMLSDRFCEIAQHTPDRPAIRFADGREWTYGQLYDESGHIADVYAGAGKVVMVPDVAVPRTYANILGAVRAGRPYMPVAPGRELRPSVLDAVAGMATDGWAYVVWTSGSTGEPKGVPVRHESVLRYVRIMSGELHVKPGDRLTQMHDFRFDFHVHDVWVALSNGACLYPVPRTQRLSPARFLRDHRITHFACVPSVITQMRKLGHLEDVAYPHLRSALFCGEALHAEQAKAFQRAAPYAILRNMYGPAEATVGVSTYVWHEHSHDDCVDDIVPIGYMFPGVDYRIVGDELQLRGTQVFDGYVGGDGSEFAGDGWYRTGDLVMEEVDGLLHFRGRKDRQVQVRGHRVELAQVEAVIREESGALEVVCAPLRDDVGNVTGLSAYVEHEGPSPSALADAVAERLPGYKCPRYYQFVARLPRNRNGKVDRKRIAELADG